MTTCRHRLRQRFHPSQAKNFMNNGPVYWTSRSLLVPQIVDNYNYKIGPTRDVPYLTQCDTSDNNTFNVIIYS